MNVQAKFPMEEKLLYGSKYGSNSPCIFVGNAICYAHRKGKQVSASPLILQRLTEVSPKCAFSGQCSDFLQVETCHRNCWSNANTD